MRSLLLLLLFLGWSALPSSAQIVDELPRMKAVEWLALIDQGKFAQSWREASPFFQKAITEADWEKNITASRKKLGPLQKRIFLRGRYFRDPEGLPKGDYFALQFEAEFDKSKILEVVIPMKDETGRWAISSYSISAGIPEKKPE